ncbi:quinol oxidase subunit B [Acidianus hospitalis W1]|jgi:cytochrome c oxidase subunit 2/cytochrome aa3-600 menaquinol oxidase subunit 2|uniref:Quinol oxidase subunit B n=1 Tax=Acidianus hospitalis (strain W1) TaxID=933801 RepID=F4B7C6_ACIHW|nr:proton pump complex quinol oxidase subunit SoxA [Acidianus hospitalis]AEE94746.1 quinol oxidase subunit B [Acidianus hospitalis W1]
MSAKHRDWEKIWFGVMLLLVIIFVAWSYESILTGSTATYRYGLPLKCGLPPKLPNGTLVIYMLAVQWSWIPQNVSEIIYLPNGTIQQVLITDAIMYVDGFPYIKVYPNQPIELILYSNNVVHAFYMQLPHGDQNWNIVPGIDSYAFFYAPATPGNYSFHCAEYCGIGHSYMYGYFDVQ